MVTRAGLGRAAIIAVVLSAGIGCSGRDGADGRDGTDGADGTNGQNGQNGHEGLPAGETYGLAATVSASQPTNGSYFVVGETVVITIELVDRFGDAVPLSALAVANLYVNGPRAMLQNRSAVGLLGATTDRAAGTHHYVTLKTTTGGNLQVVGGRLVFTTAAITTEPPGTYTVGVWAVRADALLDQVFATVDVQVGTATVEPHVFGNCARCHEGAANSVTYLHHVDPGYSPAGNPSLDSDPTRTCKSCHNQEGYAAIRRCADGTVPQSDGSTPPRYVCGDSSDNWQWVSDALVRRVHGVHDGANLLTSFNTDPAWGDFRHYQDLVFPANVRECTICHVDDAWKTPSTQACTACHDNLDMATGEYVPNKTVAAPPRLTTIACTSNSSCPAGTTNGRCDTLNGFCQIQACISNSHCVDAFSSRFDGQCNTTTGLCELRNHFGGAANDDSQCGSCHGPSSMAAVEEAHAVSRPNSTYDIDVSLTPAPANGQYYVAGEKPSIRLVISQNGAPIDHASIAQSNPNVNRAYLFVNGPRTHRIPALTSAARAFIQNTVDGPWNLTGTALMIRIGPAMMLTPTLTTMPNLANASADDVVAWLNAEAAFNAVAFAYSEDARVVIAAKPSTMRREIEVLGGTMATAMGYPEGISDVTKSSSTNYAANSFLAYADPARNDPKVTWTSGYVDYQLDDVGTVAPGTYSVLVEFGRIATSLATSLGQARFRVGIASEREVATNCVDCHGAERMHGSYPFDPDVCGSCHDYKRQMADRSSTMAPDGWGGRAPADRSNMGFGAAPLSRRVHGVHFGHYVNRPGEIHGTYDYSGVIFPQDVRNCTKCHSQSDTWTTEPSRIACNACHDSDAAIAHSLLNTWNPTPVDWWNGDESESCATCHGKNAEFAPSVAHDVSEPYLPPYPRTFE